MAHSLDDHVVQAAKARFERNAYRRKGSLSFEQLFELFGNDCSSMEDIAGLDGTTKQAVNFLYHRYFRGLTSRKDGHHRRKICIIKKRIAAKKSEPVDGVVRKIWLIAKKEGFKVGKALGKDRKSWFLTQTISIENKNCRVHHLQRASSKGHARLNANSPLLKRHEFLIVIRTIPGFPETIFIIPTKVILEVLGERSNRKIDLPCKKDNHLPKPRVDFWQYEQAWHLLRAKREEANSS